MRETFKDVELAGRKWRIKKFDARTGSFVLLKVMAKISGLIAMALSGDAPDPQVLTLMIARQIGDFSQVELTSIQNACLASCSEIKYLKDRDGNPAGEGTVPVLTASGAWGVEDLSDDTLTVMMLTTHTVVYNMMPFFDADLLKQVADSFQCYLNQFNAETSTSSPSDQ